MINVGGVVLPLKEQAHSLVMFLDTSLTLDAKVLKVLLSVIVQLSWITNCGLSWKGKTDHIHTHIGLDIGLEAGVQWDAAGVGSWPGTFQYFYK